jgi:5-methyltetrahydrofolate--homocysteine methyltransferase
MTDFKAIVEALVGLDPQKLNAVIQDALDSGISAKRILDEGLIAGMDIVGEKMESEEMFIPEVLKAAKIMAAALETLKPFFAEGELTAKGKVVIGTVKGDLHDIGKDLVAMMLESAGFEIHNLGVDVSPEKFVVTVKEKNADIVGLSALLTTTTPRMKETIDAIAEAGFRERVKVLVGGAPVTQDFADEIGADGFAPDAGSAVRLAKSFKIGESNETV